MERLTADALRREQERTLAAPRRRYSFLARFLFTGMDLVYGRRRTYSKFKVLELIARVPYQAWEQVAYVAMTHTSRDPGFARSARTTGASPAWPTSSARSATTSGCQSVELHAGDRAARPHLGGPLIREARLPR